MPRAEQFRRATAARRAGFIKVQPLVPPALNEALEASARDHPSGKSAYIVDLIAEHLKHQNPPSGSVTGKAGEKD